MSLFYRISNPTDIRELSDQMALWIAENNPKAQEWAEQPPRPSETALWEDGRWRELTEQEIGDRKLAAAESAEQTINPAIIRAILRDQVLSTDPDDAKLSTMPDLFPAWRPWIAVEAGQLYQHEGKTIRIVQSHTTQPDWNPLELPALYAVLIETPPGASYPAWQPWDGNNASLYQIGDRVTHADKYWEATTGNNHWEPGVFGWVEFAP